ncbi:hypothetical protein HWV62_30232 [Athelia sp. TMB]|nr:hypothetical protein HWV62_30232 [Athelia sp. TMB]
MVFRPRLDGGLGDEDFTMSPQIFSPQYRHRVLIRRQPGEKTNLSAMWWRPSPDNFVRLSRSSYQSLGCVHSRSIPIIDEMSWRLRDRAYRLISKNSGKNLGRLESLISAMRHGVNRLKHSPYTLRELVLDVAQTQRMYLEALAMCEYLEDHWDERLQSVGPIKRPTHTEYMGAWTTDPTVVQMLQHAGIPVYFVRPKGAVDSDAKLIKSQPSFQRNERIVTAEWLAPTQQELAVPERYSGIPGEDMHRAASQLNRYGDLATYILGINSEQDVVPVGARGSISVPPAPEATKKRSKTRGKHNNSASIATSGQVRDKWVEITGDYVPQTIPPWSKAMLSVNRMERQANPAPKAYTGYRFPDPGMLIFSESRREHNFFNWLLIRDANLRRVSNDMASSAGVATGVSNELWRMIIGVEFTERDKVAAREAVPGVLPNSRSAPHSERRQAAIAIFGNPPDGHNVQEVEWQGHRIPWNSFFEHDPLLAQEILWDLHQYSFQYDLIALDHYLCREMWTSEPHVREEILFKVLGGRDCYVVDEMQNQDFGMGAENEAERLTAYRSLEELMKKWPPTKDDPSTFSASSAYQDAVARRYCQVFAKTFGRPPILPKLLPRMSQFKGKYAYKR